MNRLLVTLLIASAGCTGDHPAEPQELPLGSIAITAPSPLTPGVEGQVYVTLRDTQYRVVTRPYTIRSTDENVLTVSTTGVVRAIALGDAAIVVTSGNMSASAYIQVTNPVENPCGWWDYC